MVGCEKPSFSGVKPDQQQSISAWKPTLGRGVFVTNSQVPIPRVSGPTAPQIWGSLLMPTPFDVEQPNLVRQDKARACFWGQPHPIARGVATAHPKFWDPTNARTV